VTGDADRRRLASRLRHVAVHGLADGRPLSAHGLELEQARIDGSAWHGLEGRRRIALATAIHDRRHQGAVVVDAALIHARRKGWPITRSCEDYRPAGEDETTHDL
jgi:hypothetical protein